MYLLYDDDGHIVGLSTLENHQYNSVCIDIKEKIPRGSLYKIEEHTIITPLGHKIVLEEIESREDDKLFLEEI